jgi:hypothetical protein
VQFVFQRYPQKVVSVMWETGASDAELETYIEHSFAELAKTQG